MINKTIFNEKKESELRNSHKEPEIRYSYVPRNRWNVLDLLTLFGTKAISSHIFYDINMKWVQDCQDKFSNQGEKITPTAFLLKAISLAQKNHPVARTFSLPFGRTVTYNDIVAGFTVEREVKGKPVVFFGEIEDPVQKSLLQIRDELKDYAEKEIYEVPKLKQQMVFVKMPWSVRQMILLFGQWFPSLRLICMKATFGLSSLGALGVKLVCGPSVCTSVFGVGKIEDRVIVENGALVVRPMMSLALCFDQRIMDAGVAAQFMQEVKKLLEGGLESFVNELKE